MRQFPLFFDLVFETSSLALRFKAKVKWQPMGCFSMGFQRTKMS